MTNTTALVKPAIVRSPSHSNPLVTNGIAAKVATSTTNDVRQTTVDRISLRDAVPASAPARYPA